MIGGTGGDSGHQQDDRPQSHRQYQTRQIPLLSHRHRITLSRRSSGFHSLFGYIATNSFVAYIKRNPTARPARLGSWVSTRRHVSPPAICRMISITTCKIAPAPTPKKISDHNLEYAKPPTQAPMIVG